MLLAYFAHLLATLEPATHNGFDTQVQSSPFQHTVQHGMPQTETLLPASVPATPFTSFTRPTDRRNWVSRRGATSFMTVNLIVDGSISRSSLFLCQSASPRLALYHTTLIYITIHILHAITDCLNSRIESRK